MKTVDAEELTEATAIILQALEPYDARDASTVLLLALASIASANGLKPETFGEHVKEALIEQMYRASGRKEGVH